MAMFSPAQDWLGITGMQEVQERSRTRYSPRLIDNLRDDHAGLLKLHADIERLALAGRDESLTSALKDFKTAFDLHMLNEHLHFYSYVEARVSNDPARLELLRAAREQVNAIARDAARFFRKYILAAIGAANRDEFLAELRQLGTVFSARVEHEERELYALYLP